MATKKTSRRQSTASQKISPHGEQRSGPVAGTAVIDGATFSQKALQYANVEGQAIFEGDIVLGNVEELQSQDTLPLAAHSIGITGQQFRWPNATIPYEIDSALPNQNRVTDAIAHWQANTRIRFVQRTSANQSQYPDYVRFVSGGGCSSMVGRRGGRQDITLGSGCTSGNAIHEIGHAVGLWHEQSREDRNTFVNIIWANIDPPMQFNFNQQISDGDDLGAYDYGSIMHYPRTAFSINGQDTITPRQTLPAGVVMGQRTGLSAGDIAGVHTMYPGATTLKEGTKDPIVDTTIKEVTKEPTRDTVKELRKDPIIDTTVKEVSKEPTRDTIKEITKEPIRDTVKESVRDPIGPIGPLRPGPLVTQPAQEGVSPFVLASPSRAYPGGVSPAAATLQDQVQQLEEAIAQLDQQMAQLLEAYEQAVQQLQGLA